MKVIKTDDGAYGKVMQFGRFSLTLMLLSTFAGFHIISGRSKDGSYVETFAFGPFCYCMVVSNA